MILHENPIGAFGRRQFLKLTDRGMVLAGQRLVVSPDSSIPSVTTMDLKE